jgi:hypothetical protein
MSNSAVCLIHHESDKDIAESLEYALKRYRISVWRTDQIEIGRNTDDEIKRAINSAKIVIVLWSNNSVNSHLLQEQAGIADKRKALIPILTDNVKSPNVSVGTQAANLVGWQGEEDNKEFIKLRQLIQSHVGKKAPPPTPNWNTIASVTGVIVAAIGVIVTALSNQYIREILGLEKKSSSVPSSPTISQPPSLDDDYTELSRLLKEKNWKQADLKTREIIWNISGVEKAENENVPTLKTGDIQKFPCEDLKKIDQLWVKYGNGRFGFSVQSPIVLRIVGNGKEITKPFNKVNQEAFGNRVGWHDENKKRWLEEEEIFTTNLTTPGHFPTWLWAINNLSNSTDSIPQKLQACKL